MNTGGRRTRTVGTTSGRMSARIDGSWRWTACTPDGGEGRAPLDETLTPGRAAARRDRPTRLCWSAECWRSLLDTDAPRSGYTLDAA